MYRYEERKPSVFTDEGQRMFLTIRDRANKLLEQAGAARLQEMISGTSGDSWNMLACVDRMKELGEIRELTNDHDVPAQYRVFVKGQSG
jgi:hypothetical protein